MPFVAEAYTEVDIYNAKWQVLLDHVHTGIGLRDQLRSAIDDWGRKVHPEPKGGKDLESRTEAVRSKVDAMATHFGPVLETISTWFEGLKPHLTACSANLDGLPLYAAVDGVHTAFARAENIRLPDKPPIDLNDADSLERRARWLRGVGEVMQRVEGGPQEIGAALRALEETLKRFNHELEVAQGRGRKDNTCALRWFAPIHPYMGPPPPTPPVD
jgi:hypothetical protein